MPGPISIARIALVTTLTALGGCGYWKSNEVDLPAVADAPVQIVNVFMRHSLIAGVGATPTSMSSSDRANAIGVAFKSKLTGPVPEHGGITAGLVCVLAGRAVRSTFPHDAGRQLETTSVGSAVEGSASLTPSVFQTEIPTVCEAQFFYAVAPPIIPPKPGEPEPARPESTDLGRACLVDGSLRAGACTATELPRIPADAPLAITGVDARIGKQSSGAFGLTYSAMVTTGTAVPDRWTVGAKAQCEVAGAIKPLSFVSAIHERNIPAGESVIGVAASSGGAELAAEPKRCTLSLLSRVGETKATLAEYCVEGEATTEGPCEGLPT